MRKVEFVQIGEARHGVSNKGKSYIRLYLDVEKLRNMEEHDVKERMYLFTSGDDFVVYAPVRGGEKHGK